MEIDYKTTVHKIGSLEDSIRTIYATRAPREMLGEDGILIRTLGPDFKG